MGNTNFRAKPNDLFVVKTKDQWERALFGRQNVTNPTAWKEAGFGDNVRLNITEYVWLSENSPNTGLWKSFSKQHRWAREINKRMLDHISAQTTPMKRYRVNSLQRRSKSFPRWYYNQVQRAIYPWNVGGFDALVRDFLADLQAQRDVTSYFSSPQPLVFSQNFSVSAAINAATTLRSTYGDNFRVQETSTGGWTLLNVGGKALWAKSIPIVATKLQATNLCYPSQSLDENGDQKYIDVTTYQLTVVEKVKGEAKISLISVQDEDIQQSQLQAAVQAAITPGLTDVAIPIQGGQNPVSVLQSFTTTEKKRIETSDEMYVIPNDPTVSRGADASASILAIGNPTVAAPSFNSSSFSLGNRSNQALVVEAGALSLSNGLLNAATLSLQSDKTLLFDGKYYLTVAPGLSEDKSLALAMTVTDTFGVIVIRDASNARIFSSVFLDWVAADENTDFHGWFSI